MNNATQSVQNGIIVTKRNGKSEPLDINKIHVVVEKACEGISGVSASEVEIASQLQFYNKMKTSDIQKTIIKAATDLISEESPNYQYVAANLLNFHLRKEVYNQKEPTSLYEHILNCVTDSMYSKEVLEWYTKEEIDTIDTYIDHEKDYKLTSAAVQQFIDKYLVRNRYTGKYYETPQFLYMLIAMFGFHATQDKKQRLKEVREFYTLISDGYLSLPTPILAGLRTPTKQFSSCVLVESGDSLKSITSTATSVVNYVARKAGIGICASAIRPKGDPVRNGEVLHTGVIPFLKLLAAAVKSVSQGGVRNASGTIYYNIWHPEIEDLLVLKNNKGTEETRIRNMDYGVCISRLFYERYIQNKDMSLFSPNDVPDLYEAFYADQDKFKTLYEKYEKDSSIKKKKISARFLLNELMIQRKETGRIYIFNVDNANENGPFKPEIAPIKMSNLCTEIALPTKPMGDDDSLIALCTLSAINLAKINEPEDFAKPCEYAVKFLDNLLSYQEFPAVEAERHTRFYRPLGIGITNLAYWFAKNELSYYADDRTLSKVDEFMEAFQYYLVKTSVDLAKEKGPCEKYRDTKYADGLVCLDWYKRSVDALSQNTPKMDWDSLREDLKKYGIRNATLSTQMPCESSVLCINSTNGIEPIRSFITEKTSKEGIVRQVAPSYPRLKNKYDLLWDITSPEGYIKIVAVMQKYMDQAISANITYNPEHYDKNEVPMSVLMRDFMLAYKFGLKTQYYLVTSPLEDENVKAEKCESGACSI